MDNITETLIYLTRASNETFLLLWGVVQASEEERTPEGDAIVRFMVAELKVRGLA